MLENIRNSRNYKWWAFWTVAIALFVMVMDLSVTFLALSTIADEFNQGLRLVTWVALSSALVITAILLPVAKLAEFWGRKRFFIIGMALFTIGALLSAFAPNLFLLIGARVVMAVGAAMAQAIVLAIVTSVFPSNERGKALGMITTAVSIGGIAGPIVGGPVIAELGWRAIFIVLAVPTGLAIIAASVVLDDDRIGSSQRANSDHRPHFDWQGGLLSMTAISVFILTIANPFGWPFISLPIIGGAVASVVLGVAFIIRERMTPYPLLSLSFFSNSTFRWANSTRVFGFTGSAAVFFLMPVFLQSFLGYSPTNAGLLIFGNALGIGTAAQVSGRLSDRIGTRLLTVGGTGGLLGVNIIFAFLGESPSIFLIAPLLFTHGILMGLWMPPNMSATIGSVERQHYGTIGALVNLTRNIGSITGQAIAVAIVTGILTAMVGFETELSAIGTGAGGNVRSAFIYGWRVAFLVLGGFMALALFSAFMTRDLFKPEITVGEATPKKIEPVTVAAPLGQRKV